MKLMKSTIATLFVVVIYAACCQSESNNDDFNNSLKPASMSERSKQAVLAAISLTGSITAVIAAAEFTSVVAIIAGVTSSLFTVAHVVTNVVFVYQKNESPEFQSLKQDLMHSHMRLNNVLGTVPHSYNAVKSLIEWNAIRINFVNFENSIRSMSDILTTRQDDNMDETAIEQFNAYYIKMYETMLKGAPNKLISAVVSQDKLFITKLQDAVREYTENHRYNVQAFFIGFTQLLMQGMHVEGMYLRMRYQNDVVSKYMQTLWESKMQLYQQILINIDQEIETTWEQQFHLDIDWYLETYSNINDNQKLATNLQQYLTEKYRWRYWFTLIFDNVNTGVQNHDVQYCKIDDMQVELKITRTGRYHLIASVSKKSSYFKNLEFMQISKDALSKLQYFTTKSKEIATELAHKLKGFKGNEEQNCFPNKVVAVVHANSQLGYAGEIDHFHSGKMCIRRCKYTLKLCWFHEDPCYNLVFFG